jgi:hypothetical protein
MPRRDELEQRAFQLITKNGSEGILQCDLWKELNATGRDGSRIALKLESKNLVRREKELFNGRWTYRIFAAKPRVKVDSIVDIACVSCPNISKCESGSEISPNTCSELTQWILSLCIEK